MKMSTKGRYGLRVMVELAAQHGRGVVQVDSIAKNQQISANYIHVIVGALKSAGLVRAVRGPSGGVELARPPDRITAREVIDAVEGDAPVECVTCATACQRSGNCVTRELWSEVHQAVQKVLGGHTLEQLAARQRAYDAPAPMFHI